MAEIVIRKAAVEDIEAVVRCLQIAFAPYREAYSAEGFADTVVDAEALASRMHTMTVFVAQADRQTVGTIAAGVVSAGEGHIRGMAVLPEWQGSPVGIRLLTAAERELGSRGCRYITLDTTAPLERAIRFYEKHGYRRSGKLGDFYGQPLYEFRKDLPRL